MQNEYEGSDAVFIDKARVQEGLILAKSGQQQLPQIPERKTLYYFTVSHNNHCSVCEILITPIKHTQYPNFFFFPVRRYTKCCDSAPENELKQQHQTIYDVLIRPNQWRFSNDDSDEVKLPQNASTIGICRDHSKLGLEYLLQTATPTSSGAAKDVAFRTTSGSESPCRCTDAADEANSSDTNGTKPRPRKKRKNGKTAADTISKKLLKAAEVKTPGSFNNVSETHCLSNVEQLDALPILTTYDERFEFAEHLRKLYSKTHDRAGQIIWANKRYSFDMRFLLRRERKIDGENEADRSARSSMLINRIASKLTDNNPKCYCGAQVYDLFAIKVPYDDDLYTYGVYLEKGCPVHGGQSGNTASPNSLLYSDTSGVDDQQIQQDLHGVNIDTPFTNSQVTDPLEIFNNLDEDGAGSLDKFGIFPYAAEGFWDFMNTIPDS
ncbi:hypothetical protein E5D57_001690 [Metarhizium anisopliae]|nr:hypothetical protein E5D57_001690 [Metarhizium anisopliae]